MIEERNKEGKIDGSEIQYVNIAIEKRQNMSKQIVVNRKNVRKR